jgi:hypothetical protein
MTRTEPPCWVETFVAIALGWARVGTKRGDVSLSDLKEAFSHAYVRAVAHAAGYFVQEASRHLDADGIDLTMFSRGPGGTVRSPRLDLQVKGTARIGPDDPFPFDLPIKNYDELRSEDFQVPRILVVVALPEDVAHWVSATDQELVLRHCGYWKSLQGAAAIDNDTSVRVKLSRSACFHVEQVQRIMDRIREGTFR